MQISTLAKYLFVPGACLVLACGGDDGAATSSHVGPHSGGTSSGGASSGGAGKGGAVSGGAWAGGSGGVGGSLGGSAGQPGTGGSPACGPATTPCSDKSQCCSGLECGTTTLGQVCCGMEGVSCATANGEDCCGDLLCVNGACGYDTSSSCSAPCTEAPALVIEKQRLAAIGGSFLGICGDANHTYGYHVPAANLPSSDYSLEGAANVPVCEWHACAIDIGMDWPASRTWLKWLIGQIASDNIQGIAEVIGSYDGVDVRYWSDSSGWSTNGIPYTGTGHDTWTHVAVYRSTALADHHVLLGWTANGGP